PNAASASSACPAVEQVRDAAVGMPACAITCLAKDLEPSIIAAPAPGPKQARPASRSAPAAPATSGASGPITTRSGVSLPASARICSGDGAVSGWVCASAAMPGLPGAACRSWSVSRLSARSRACSRPPDPMTRMRTPRAYRAGRECPPLRRVSSGKTGRCHVQDGHDALLRQAAELADSSLRARSIAAELKAQSEHLIYQLAQTQK